MALGALESTVRVVNRVVGPDGKKVPYTAYFGGETVTFTDHLDVPIGIARVLVHNSMYKQEPDSFTAEYRLGCQELDAPTDPLPAEEVGARIELIERELLPPDRHFGAPDRFGRKLQPFVRKYRPMRTDPLSVEHPGSSDGAFRGSYGEPKVDN